MVQNKGIIFKAPPDGWPVEGEHLVVEDRPFDADAEPPANGITTKNYYLSYDPYLRGRLRAPEGKSYIPAFDLNKPIVNAGIAKVLKSNHPDFKPGEVIRGLLPFEEYSTLQEPWGPYEPPRKVENPYKLDVKLFLGALGMPGLTAYSSLYEIGEPKRGETIFVSAASGAVGQLVGQLAKHDGLRVIGSVGSDEKLDFIVKELGIDAGFNYKKEKPAEALERLAPGGVDIYYDNVGGETLDAALGAMNDFGRIICSGAISQYNNANGSDSYGPKNIYKVVTKRLKMQGFIVADPQYGPKYTAEHQQNLQKWIAEGSIKTRESVTVGVDNGVKGFLGLLRGENFGKAILEIESLKV